MNVKRKDIFWFIVLRLIIITSLLVSAVIIQYSTSVFLPLESFYHLILIGYFFSFIYFLLFVWKRNYFLQASVQIIFDLLLITAFVYISGGLKGSFYFLYVFEIIAASVILSPRAAYLTAALSAIFFGLLVEGMYFGLLSSSFSEKSMDISLGLLLNNIFIAWSVFFLMAFLTNHLTRSLRKTRSELKVAQKEIEIRNRLAVAGQVSAQLAHEIRNPLAAISGSAQFLRHEQKLNKRQEELMDIIIKESRRVSQSIEQFLSLSSPQKKTFSRVDLSAVLKEILTLLKRSGEMNGDYQVGGNFDSIRVPYFGNSNQFKQVFWNLIKNSLKAMPQGGTLTIQFNQEKEDGIQLRVGDTGRGMTEEEKQKIFDPFYSGFEEGMGIGMSVVRQIVDDYGGKIQIYSEPEEGTEVIISLPQKNKRIQA
ncbi:MAG: two-component system sensor histidine kinase NtrB [Candidatus Aminicenantes bacterium]